MTALVSSARLLAVAAAALLAFQAHANVGAGRLGTAPTPGTAMGASFIDVNLAGFQTFGDFGDPANTSVFLSIAPGSTITGWDYINLSFTTNGESYLSEFVLSVNNTDATGFFDAAPSDIDAPGTFGPVSGPWNGALGGSGGDPFTVADGQVWVTAYELFTDEGLNATVDAGTLRIYYNVAAIPEPGTYGLMALGLLGVAAAARRRREH